MPTIEELLRIGGSPLQRARQGSVQWFHRTVRKVRKLQDPSAKEAKTFTGFATKGPGLVGQMVAYSYDPKLKDVLPYYDRYPLVIPLTIDGKYMLGLNLHYLPPRVRLSFVRALQALVVETNGVKKLEISYGILKSARALGNYAPCVKKYLLSHFRSKVVQVDQREWEFACLLPLARFVGADEGTVWADSMSGRRRKRRKI